MYGTSFTSQLCVALALVTLVHRDSSAADAALNSKPSSSKKAVCRENPDCSRLLSAAKESSAVGQIEDARGQYVHAYQITPDPLLLFNIARMLQRTRRYPEAIAYYRQYLSEAAAEEVEMRNKAVEYLEQAQRESVSVSATTEPTVPHPSDGNTVVSAGNLTASPSTMTAAIARSRLVASPSSGSTTPLVQKWWLWTGVGVVVAGVAAAIGLGVVSSRPDISDSASLRPFAN